MLSIVDCFDMAYQIRRHTLMGFVALPKALCSVILRTAAFVELGMGQICHSYTDCYTEHPSKALAVDMEVSAVAYFAFVFAVRLLLRYLPLVTLCLLWAK